jgi:hypothetical protein
VQNITIRNLYEEAEMHARQAPRMEEHPLYDICGGRRDHMVPVMDKAWGCWLGAIAPRERSQFEEH